MVCHSLAVKVVVRQVVVVGFLLEVVVELDQAAVAMEVVNWEQYL